VNPLLFIAGAGQAFFLPLLGALALGLVGHAALNRTMGQNQGWNHAGNLAAALLAMALVSVFGVGSVFIAVTVVSVLAAGSVFLIRDEEIDESRASGLGKEGKAIGLRELLKDRRVIVLLAATALFHLANAPVMPFLGAYVKKLKGSHVQVAAIVLTAQAVMIPVALAAGWLCDRCGRKVVFGIGFVVLPVRIFLYSLTQDPWMLIALQTLDGIGAGIYGVVIVAICADLTKGKGGFNALSGIVANALAVGGVVGPLGAGFAAEHLGYNGFFYVFAGIAAVAAILFITLMPETGSGPCPQGPNEEANPAHEDEA
jgi:predicted MFS family arabinose efflux permease